MVHSKIKPKIEYTEIRTIDDEDNEYETSVYEAEIHDKRVVIALGKPKSEHFEITYCPVYLISEGIVRAKIGVAEIRSSDFAKYIDDDGRNIDAEKYANEGNELLLYKFVVKEFLELSNSDPSFYSIKQKEEKDKEKEKEKDKDKKKDKKQDIFDIDLDEKYKKEAKSIFTPIGNSVIPDALKEETKEDADKLINETANSNWVQKFMKNSEYSLQKIPRDGNCFFSVIVEAFKQIGQKTTVELLREIVADSLTQEIFEMYLEMYKSSILETNKNQSNVVKIVEKIKEYKTRYKQAEKKSDKDKLIENIEIMQKDKEELVKKNNEIELIDEHYKHFRFMKDVNSLKEMKEAVKKSSYWADEIAISQIEHKLNIKMILLSKESYNNGSEDTVMKCVVSSEQKPIPEPDYYIITEYLGDHYELISYKEKKIFSFSEIPYRIKALIVQKCREGSCGIFKDIKDFKQFRKNLGEELDIMGKGVVEPNNLYDDDINFMFYDKSSDTKPPGTGSGEKIKNQDLFNFLDLQIVKDWRRMLDDEYASPFILDGKRWMTVEHYYQACKFKKRFSNFYATFSLDSKSEISDNVKKAKGAGGKTGKFEKHLLRPDNITIDPDFYGGRDQVERGNALKAKFEQHPNLKKVLLDTKKAKLLHFVRGSEPEVDTLLMELRAKL
jgi:predicted NAD-dependent protein-ADP-ribosyltransferase YbiA (DUF1768 family)